MTSVKSVSIPSVQRLPIYLRFLKEQRNHGETIISCTRIAEEFGQLSVQIRKDISITGITGRPKIGYRLDELIDGIERFLGWDQTICACLVGAGSLGTAILGYYGFVDHGMRIVAAFDSSDEKIGTTIHGCPIYDIRDIVSQSAGKHIDVGILTVPTEVAQKIADKLVAIGVRGIWNYAPCRLSLPDHIVCEDAKLSASLAVLSSRLKMREEKG